jgi:hypothetical protein
VSCRGASLAKAGVFGPAQPNGTNAPASPNPALAVLVITSTAVFPASSVPEGVQPERPCLFASGEASGSERLRLPPQVRSELVHSVR